MSKTGVPAKARLAMRAPKRSRWTVPAAAAVGLAAYFILHSPPQDQSVELRFDSSAQLSQVSLSCAGPAGETSGVNWRAPLQSKLVHKFSSSNGLATCRIALRAGPRTVEEKRSIELRGEPVTIRIAPLLASLQTLRQ